MSSFDVWPGVPYPLGATVDEHGVNFAVASQHATGVELCLFDTEDPKRELARLPLRDQTNHVFHGFVPGLKAGALYGFRVAGPWAPHDGHRFNAHKLLVDPYARAVSGKVDWSKLGRANVLDERDSADGVPRSVVVADDFDWRGDRRPEVLWRKAVIYEAHVRGLTMQHPDVPVHQRGTYAGLAHPSVIAHLKSIGVTSVQLLPVHECVPEGFLGERGLTNYWGYNTLGFFAPEQRYASTGSRGQQVNEFKEMVRALHAADLEVLLDVVYNHTCEGNELGPTLSFRGIDNATYYWLDSSDRARSRDFTGCGNSLAVYRPQVLKLVMDSLRHWVREFHVDGFRFDLATTLVRGPSGEFDPHAAFFAAIAQDPVLSRVKLIAEPWDVGPHGYRLGNFPMPFAEWNDRYRNTLRRFWRGDGGQLAELGSRLAGSSDYFKLSGRRPGASINYVACHDGFTLADVTAFDRKHNLANKEENRDGSDDNQSWNHGVEGPTDDEEIVDARIRTIRNLLASVFLSVGTPMLMAGDEFGRTQHGNNNAYCQDNELSWVDWRLGPWQRRLLDFTRALATLRASQPVLQRRNFFQGATLDDSRFRDLVWFHPKGTELDHDDWRNPELRCFGMFLGGDAITTRDNRGQRLIGDTLLVYFNAAARPQPVVLPAPSWGTRWEKIFETASEAVRTLVCASGDHIELPERSVLVLRLRH
ncbi:MAG: glycogen debranching enzyme GlgX [Archangium gephyra]|uniref:Glycogen debranching enzyme GlgX n=1 Tax=Archangium gephyra TaxID=48 RepID=A0A2W5TDX2_9BACT|nr:MAG: glycogen debranching enzyme GlgX [Archangium gephyra]